MEYHPNRVTIEADVDNWGWLVLTDVWHPDWQTTVDGQATPMYRANYTFRAVQLPPGHHRIEFVFNPLSFRIGRAVSLGTLGGIGFFGIWTLLRRRRQSAAIVRTNVEGLAAAA